MKAVWRERCLRQQSFAHADDMISVSSPINNRVRFTYFYTWHSIISDRVSNASYAIALHSYLTFLTHSHSLFHCSNSSSRCLFNSAIFL